MVLGLFGDMGNNYFFVRFGPSRPTYLPNETVRLLQLYRSSKGKNHQSVGHKIGEIHLFRACSVVALGSEQLVQGNIAIGACDMQFFSKS